MTLNGLMHKLPAQVKKLLFFFVVTLTFGYTIGFLFIKHTTDLKPQGVYENYVGNEENEDAEVMKFKKSDGEMYTMIHDHTISLSIMFLILGVLISITSLPAFIKGFLIIEPFISIVLTFGGIGLMWNGVAWMKYVVIFSGSLLTFTFYISVILIIWQLLKK
ncbi:MAG: hypothetical protein Kow0079_07630 [Vicingaceae bacterium]